MAGHTITNLRIVDLRHQATLSEPAARRLHIDFGPFNQVQRPNIVLIGGGAAFVVGLVLWGFLTMSILAGVDSLLGETESRQTVADTSRSQVFDCANFGAVRVLSAEDEARLQAQCGASLPVSAPVAVQVSTLPEAPVAPSATADNRANCDQIRGTNYRSDGERTWYLANCVTQ